MNDSPNYHSLNTCARDPESPERLLLLTIFIMLSVITLGGIRGGGMLRSRAAPGQPWVILPWSCQSVCQEIPSVPFHQDNLEDRSRTRLCPNSSCCGWADSSGPSRWGDWTKENGFGLTGDRVRWDTGKNFSL